jgi:hypothetical protein
MRFIEEEIEYICVGQTYAYFYSGTLNTYLDTENLSLLDKIQFLHFIYHDLFSSIRNHSVHLPAQLHVDLASYFDEFKEDEFTHWKLFSELKTLENYDLNSLKYNLDPITKELILRSDDFTLVVPPPYIHVMGEDSEGEIYDVDELNITSFQTLTFNNLSDEGELYFMSEDAIKCTSGRIDAIVIDIIAIFGKNNMAVNSFHDLIGLL